MRGGARRRMRRPSVPKSRDGPRGRPGRSVQCHLVFQFRAPGRTGGADPPVRCRPPGRLVEGGTRLILQEKSGSGGTRADQGVRPTTSAGFAGPGKLSGIGQERLRHI